jgi:hypothetical protein
LAAGISSKRKMLRQTVNRRFSAWEYCPGP